MLVQKKKNGDLKKGWKNQSLMGAGSSTPTFSDSEMSKRGSDEGDASKTRKRPKYWDDLKESNKEQWDIIKSKDSNDYYPPGTECLLNNLYNEIFITKLSIGLCGPQGAGKSFIANEMALNGNKDEILAYDKAKHGNREWNSVYPVISSPLAISGGAVTLFTTTIRHGKEYKVTLGFDSTKSSLIHGIAHKMDLVHGDTLAKYVAASNEQWDKFVKLYPDLKKTQGGSALIIDEGINGGNIFDLMKASREKMFKPFDGTEAGFYKAINERPEMCSLLELTIDGDFKNLENGNVLYDLPGIPDSSNVYRHAASIYYMQRECGAIGFVGKERTISSTEIESLVRGFDTEYGKNSPIFYYIVNTLNILKENPGISKEELLDDLESKAGNVWDSIFSRYIGSSASPSTCNVLRKWIAPDMPRTLFVKGTTINDSFLKELKQKVDLNTRLNFHEACRAICYDPTLIPKITVGFDSVLKDRTTLPKLKNAKVAEIPLEKIKELNKRIEQDTLTKITEGVIDRSGMNNPLPVICFILNGKSYKEFDNENENNDCLWILFVTDDFSVTDVEIPTRKYLIVVKVDPSKIPLEFAMDYCCWLSDTHLPKNLEFIFIDGNKYTKAFNDFNQKMELCEVSLTAKAIHNLNTNFIYRSEDANIPNNYLADVEFFSKIGGGRNVLIAAGNMRIFINEKLYPKKGEKKPQVYWNIFGQVVHDFYHFLDHKAGTATSTLHNQMMDLINNKNDYALTAPMTELKDKIQLTNSIVHEIEHRFIGFMGFFDSRAKEPKKYTMFATTIPAMRRRSKNILGDSFHEQAKGFMEDIEALGFLVYDPKELSCDQYNF